MLGEIKIQERGKYILTEAHEAEARGTAVFYIYLSNVHRTVPPTLLEMRLLRKSTSAKCSLYPLGPGLKDPEPFPSWTIR